MTIEHVIYPQEGLHRYRSEPQGVGDVRASDRVTCGTAAIRIVRIYVTQKSASMPPCQPTDGIHATLAYKVERAVPGN